MNKTEETTGIHPKDFRTAAMEHGRHFSRYLFAAAYAEDKYILDGACGNGYGSAYLARSARFVLGLDLDRQRISFARDNFSFRNLRFEVQDLHERIETKTPFDLLISFETLEHVRDPSHLLANMVHSLADDATALISVPNGTKEKRSGGKHYHPNQFSSKQFQALLSSCFQEVRPHSQVYHAGLGHYLGKLAGRGTHQAKDYRFVPGFDEQAKTWLAVCEKPRRDRRLPECPDEIRGDV